MKLWNAGFYLTMAAMGTSISAGTLVLQNGINGYFGCSDTYVVMASDRAQGTRDKLVVEGYHCGSCIDQRVLMRFDLSMLPPGAKITNATLSLYSIDQPRPGGSMVNVHKIQRAWEENTASWYEARPGVSWLRPGGDFDETPASSYTYESDILVWHTIDLTSIVKAFVSTPDSNFGVALYMVPTMLTVRYLSSNSTDQEHRPKLTIETDGFSAVRTKIAGEPSPPTISVTRTALSLLLPAGGVHSLTVNDMQGHALTRRTVSGGNANVDISALPAGVYVVSLRGGNMAISQRFTIGR